MKKRLATFLISTTLLFGCSSNFAYNNLDWLVYWYLDDYIELNKSQRKVFDGKLDVWHKWHRQDELVRYKQHLQAVKQKFNSKMLTGEEWQAEFAAGRKHWERLRDRIVPDLVEIAPSLTDDQVDSLFAEMAKSYQENLEERQEMSAEEVLEEREEDLLDGIKDYIGKLTKQQKQMVKEAAPQFKSNFENWLNYTTKIQSDAKTLMQNRSSDPDFAAKLTRLMTHPEDYQTQNYIDNRANNRKLYGQLLAQIQPSLTAKQKRKLNKKIDGLIDDIDDLIND